MSLGGANLVGTLWIAWAVYWFIAARSVKQDRRQESPLSRAAHIVPLGIAAWLLWAPMLPGHFLEGRFLPDTPATYGIGVAIVAAGLGFAIWARNVLGRNWSGVVTVKEDHELILNGPYRYVRHPIYTGLLLAFAGSAIARGEWRGVLAFAIAFAALWRKLRVEERWMVETFGDAYLRYRAEVRALIPFVL
jgi:protein-S-isoprenylcysteine O-methyltransferase Ste14